MEYGINKGIGKSVEFRGLKAQYLFIFAGGLLAVFVVFVILYMAGVDQWVCIAFGVAAASVLVWLTFRLNARYGEHGLMKLFAARRHPRYLLNRKSLRRLLKRKGAAYEKHLESHHAGKQVPAPGRGRRLYHQQGRGHNGRLSGRTPGAVHRHVRRVRGDPRRLVQGPEGLARIQRGTQAGLGAT